VTDATSFLELFILELLAGLRQTNELTEWTDG